MGLQGTPGGLTDIEIGYLDDLLDVVLSTPTSGQYLQYDLANNRWINATVTTGGTGTVTSAGAVGLNGIVVGGSPITGEGVFTLSLLDITPRLVTASGAIVGPSLSIAGIISGASLNVTGDINAATGRVLASAATLTAKFTGAAAAFSALVSADAGIKTTTVSADSIGVTGDINATAGRVLASAATLTGKFTGATAAFSGKVSADGGLNTTTVSAASIGVTGDINAAAGRVLASAATLTGKFTGATAAFSGIVSADAGIMATTVSASSTIGGSNLSGTNTGDVTLAGQGYITIAGQVVSAGKIANANMVNMNAVTMKANATTSAAVPADVSFSTFLDAAVSAIQGDIIYRGAAAWVRLAAGTSGQYLQTLGVSANPVWGTVATGGSVTSAGISGPSIITWSNSPITTQGVFTGVLANQNPNIILAGPVSGAAAAPTFRTQINEDLPLQSQILVVSAAFNGTTATDASLASHFRGVAVSAFTLSNPTNARDGQRIIWEIIQDGTGTRVMTLGNKFAFGTDITAATLTTAINKRDFLGAIYDSIADKFYITAFVKGY